MVKIFFEGIILGLIIAITIGPAFFSIIQTSINRGFKYGVFMAIGILISDITILSVSYIGAFKLFNSVENKLLIGIVAGSILIAYGIYSYFRKPDILRQRTFIKNKKSSYKAPGPYTYVVKGYFLNILNPFLLAFWFIALGTISAQAEEGKLFYYVIVFFSGTLITIFGTDILKSFIGNRLKEYLKPRKILSANRIVGLLLVVFGTALIIRVILKFI